jgi:hypothetical protein
MEIRNNVVLMPDVVDAHSPQIPKTTSERPQFLSSLSSRRSLRLCFLPYAIALGNRVQPP